MTRFAHAIAGKHVKALLSMFCFLRAFVFWKLTPCLFLSFFYLQASLSFWLTKFGLRFLHFHALLVAWIDRTTLDLPVTVDFSQVLFIYIYINYVALFSVSSGRVVFKCFCRGRYCTSPYFGGTNVWHRFHRRYFTKAMTCYCTFFRTSTKSVSF